MVDLIHIWDPKPLTVDLGVMATQYSPDLKNWNLTIGYSFVSWQRKSSVGDTLSVFPTQPTRRKCLNELL